MPARVTLPATTMARCTFCCASCCRCRFYPHCTFPTRLPPYGFTTYCPTCPTRCLLTAAVNTPFAAISLRPTTCLYRSIAPHAWRSCCGVSLRHELRTGCSPRRLVLQRRRYQLAGAYRRTFETAQRTQPARGRWTCNILPYDVASYAGHRGSQTQAREGHDLVRTAVSGMARDGQLERHLSGAEDTPASLNIACGVAKSRRAWV